MERMIKLCRAAALLLLVGLVCGAIALASLRVHHMNKAHATARQLASEFGQLICDHSGDSREQIGEAATEWVRSRPEALQATLELEGDPVVVIPSPHWSSGDEQHHAAAELTVVRDGVPWGQLHIRVAPQVHSAISGVVTHPLLGGGIGACVLVVTWMALAMRTRGNASGFGGLWADARHRVAETMDFLAEGIVVLDPRGRIVFANRAFSDGVNIAPAVLTGQFIDALGFRPHNSSATTGDWCPWRDLIADPSTPVRGQVEWEYEGRKRAFNVSGRAILTRRRVRGIVLTFDDITILEQHRRDLEVARDAADRANQAKSVFLANMSHEIRTPINGVMGTLELLNRTPLKNRQRQFLHGARESASALLRLINDILDLSKLEAGKLELCEVDFDLEECALSALRVISPAAAAKGLELILTIAPGAATQLRGDPERLRQIFINLSANATKFTATGEVEVILAVERGDSRACVRVQVRDTGIGIPPDRLDRLFKSFSQVDSSTSRKFGGTGLGLAISKQLVEMMNGSIRVTSEVGVGSVFHFDITLPLAAAKVHDAAPSAEASAADRLFVLLEPCDRARAATLAGLDSAELRHVAMTTDEFFSGQIGTLADASELVAIIGAVTWTPEHTAVARRIHTERPAIRVLAMTLVEPDPDVEHALAADQLVQGWLRKPCGTRDLGRQLRTVLEHGEDQASETADLVIRPADAAGKRVLLAEDNPVGQMITTEFVEALGLCTVAVDRGDRALEVATHEQFDVILMDCHLPELDGFEVTRRIRAAESAGGRTPVKIIALTANAMQGDRERCLKAGMDDYVSKPVSRTELGRAIAHALGVQLVPPTATLPDTPMPETTSPTPAPSSQPAPLNVRELHSRCLRQPALVEQLLQLFQSTTDQDLVQLSTAITEHNKERTSEIAHSIAGCALQVGAAQLAALARQIENEAVAASDKDIERDLENLKTEFARCIEFLPQAGLPATSAASTPSGKSLDPAQEAKQHQSVAAR